MVKIQPFLYQGKGNIMEGFSYSEWLNNQNIQIKTSSNKIKKMLEEYKNARGQGFSTHFAKLSVYSSDVQLKPEDLYTKLFNSEALLKGLDNKATGLYDIIVHCFEDVISNKDNFKQIIKQNKADESLNIPSYIKEYEEKDVDLFETVLSCKPNKHDRLLYKNFLLIGEMVAYTHNDSLTLINTDLKNEKLEIGMNQYAKENSLYDMICKDMAPVYENYMNKLKTKLATIDAEALQDSIEEGNCGILEDIFLNEIPSSFRHIVRIKSCWKTLDKSKILEKFVCKPLKNMTEMRTLEFTEFLNYLTKHFKLMTAGCLDKQEKYLTWSNDFNNKSVSTWILPTEEEWKNAKLPECWDNFLTPKASPRMMQRVYFYLGAIQDAKNKAQQALVISDEGQTGKGTLTRLLHKILPPKSFGYVTNSCFKDDDQFGLSNCNVNENHIVCISEYDGNCLCSNKGKAAIGGDTITLNVKNRQSIQWDTYGVKFLITSNEGCQLKEHSYRRRIIPVSFKQTHNMKDNFNEKQLQEFVDTGREFLNYCYKVYMECPLRSNSGEYLVMDAETEEMYLKNETLPFDDRTRLIRAFSRDSEIADYFYVGDYSDSDETIEFENMFNNIFNITNDEKDSVPKKVVQQCFETWAIENDVPQVLDIKKGYGNEWTHIKDLGKGTQWWKILQYAKTQGIDYKTKNADGIKVKHFFGVKLKEEWKKKVGDNNYMERLTRNNQSAEETIEDIDKKIDDSFFDNLK